MFIKLCEKFILPGYTYIGPCISLLHEDLMSNLCLKIDGLSGVMLGG